MTQWILVSDSNESEPFDSREAAEDEKQSLGPLADVTVQEVEANGEVHSDESEDDEAADDVETDVIEMSGGDGGNENGQDDDDSDDEGGCPACGHQSSRIYRCDNCGYDLAKSGGGA